MPPSAARAHGDAISPYARRSATTAGGSIARACGPHRVYHMLKNGVDYLDLGPDHLHGADKTKSVNRLLRKIEDLGF